MDIQHVPPALQERLGPDATLGLLSLVDVAGREWKAEAMNESSERFERRLIEETSKLRLDFANTESRLLAKIGDVRTDVLKWSFAFWIGQVVAITAIMSVLLRVG